LDGVKRLAVALIDVGIIHVHQMTEQENKQAEEFACQIAKSPLARIKDAAHHLAEAEAMVLFQRAELEAETLLVDELAAREIASSKAIPIIGFPGILRTACLDGIIDVAQMRSILLECQRKGTRYSNTFIEQLCKSIGVRKDGKKYHNNTS